MKFLNAGNTSLFTFTSLMATLFDMQPLFPPGFSYYPEYLTVEEELQLYQEILKIELNTFMFQRFAAKRKVASFGYDYSFDKRSLSKGTDIPKAFHPLIKAVSVIIRVQIEKIGELLVTEYPVGSVINWHRDAPPFDIIAGISLQADCIFKLRPYDKTKQGRHSIISVPVKRRSLYVMQDAARSEWEHSTAPVKNVRYSITLRTLKNKNEI